MEAAVRTLRQDAKVIGLISVAHGLSHFYQLVIAVLFPLIKVDLGVSYAELGATTALFYIVSGLCQTAAGFMVDRYGARRVLVGGLALCSAGVLIAGFAQHYSLLVVAAAVAGVGNSVFHPADFAILNARVEQKRLGYAFSVHGVAGTMGWALAPAFSYGVSALYGWHTALMLSAGLGATMLVLLVGSGEALAVERARTAARAAAQPLAADVRVLLQRPVLMCFFFFMLLAAALIGVQSFGVAALIAYYGTPAALASAALTAYLVGQALGILFGGYVAGRTARHDAVAASGMAGSALCMLGVALGALGPAMLAPLLALSGFPTGTTNPSRDLLVRAATPKGAAGKVYGFVYSGLDVGSMSVPVLYGWLLDHGRPQGVFYGVFGLLLLTVLTVLQLPERAARAQAQGVR